MADPPVEEPPAGRSSPEVGAVTRRAARNIVYAAIAEIMGKFGTFAFVIIGARALTKAEFGTFSYALALGTLVAPIGSWGIDVVVVREGTRHPDRLPTLLGQAYLWRYMLVLLGGVGAAVFGALTSHDAPTALAFVLVVLAVFLDVLAQTPGAAAEAKQDLRGLAVARVAQRLSTAALAGLAIALGFGLIGFSSALLVGSVIGAVGFTITARWLGVRARFRGTTRRGMLRLARMAAPIGLDSLLALAVLRIDTVLLEVIRGSSEVASYAVATRLLETVLFLSWACQQALFPIISGSRELWRFRYAIERGLAICSVLFVPFLVVLLTDGGEIIKILFGQSYSSSATPVMFMAAAPLLIAYGNLTTEALFVRGRPLLAAAASASAGVVNVAVNLVLIPRFGATGAAITTTLSYLFEGVVLYVLALRIIGRPRIDRAIAESVAAGAFMAAAMLLVPGGLAVRLVVGGAVFGGVWLALSARFAPENIAVLKSFLRRAPIDLPTTSGEARVDWLRPISWQFPNDGP
jgi:O-antigen/teichoic acid export membrane protein